MRRTRTFLATGIVAGLAALASPTTAAADVGSAEVADAGPALTAPPGGRAPLSSEGSSEAGPTIYELQNNNLRPSTVQKDGGRPVVSLGKTFQRVCAFQTYRFNDATGSEDLGWQYDSSLRYVDYLPGYANGAYTSYAMRAQDCSGNLGPWAYSQGYYPYVEDGDELTRSGWSGIAYASNAYGGSVRTASGLGTSATFRTGYDYNVALYARTGPKGGTATVYVNGAKKGTINFYSPTQKERVLVWATGAQEPQLRNVRLVMTRAGARGGTTMSLDALGRFAS